MKGVTRDADVDGGIHTVSIHTPNEGSDRDADVDGGIHTVSIHTPNEGSDSTLAGKTAPRRGFNPHSQ